MLQIPSIPSSMFLRISMADPEPGFINIIISFKLSILQKHTLWKIRWLSPEHTSYQAVELGQGCCDIQAHALNLRLCSFHTVSGESKGNPPWWTDTQLLCLQGATVTWKSQGKWGVLVTFPSTTLLLPSVSGSCAFFENFSLFFPKPQKQWSWMENWQIFFLSSPSLTLVAVRS